MNSIFALALIVIGAVVIVSATLMLLFTESVLNIKPSFRKFTIIFTAIIWGVTMIYPTLPMITLFLWYKYILTGIVITFFLPYEQN